MSAPAGPDRAALDERLADLRALMATHGGGVELAGVGGDGSVRLRFTGLCAGCRLRPLTFASTIEPALTGVSGVRHVEADGARISEEAVARMRHYHREALLPGSAAEHQ